MAVSGRLEARLRADLDDWQAWLVYADLLTDRGDVRGELIGLAHQLATVGHCAAAAGRIHEFQMRHAAVWRGGWKAPGAHLQWRHGFVCGLSMRWSRPLWADFEDLVCRHPLLVSLTLDDHPIPAADVKHLARSEAACRLTQLSMGQTALGDEGVEELACAEALRGLRALHVNDNGVTAVGAGLLAGSKTLGGLTLLDLHGNQIGDAGVRALARSTTLRGLTTLYVGHNEIGNSGASALASLCTLRTLDVARNPIQADGLAALSTLRCRVFHSGSAGEAAPDRQIHLIYTGSVGDIGLGPPRATTTRPKGARIALGLNRGDPIAIGRSDDCALLVQHKSVARRALNLRLVGGATEVCDLNSGGGSQLERAGLVTDRPWCALEHGDRLSIGAVVFDVDFG